MKQRFHRLVLAIALLVPLASCDRDTDAGDEVTGPEVAPHLTSLRDAHGKTLDEAQLRGKRLLVNVWSISCSSCIKEMPSLQAAADSREDAGLILVTIDGTPQRAAQIARDRGVRAPVLIGDQELARTLNVKQVPTTFVLDPDGRTRRVLLGERSRAAFERALDAI